MGIPEGNFNFQLSRPIEYKFMGSSAETTSITLYEPGMEHLKFYPKLKQMLTRCSIEFQTKKETIEQMAGDVVKPLHEDTETIENDSEGLAEALAVMLNASESVDMVDFLQTFKKMVLMPLEGNARPICKVDDNCNMTEMIWSKLRPNDVEKMAVRWCAFFAMPSQEGEPTTSGPQLESVTERTAV